MKTARLSIRFSNRTIIRFSNRHWHFCDIEQPRRNIKGEDLGEDLGFFPQELVVEATE
jgi:hypothetical protein